MSTNILDETMALRQRILASLQEGGAIPTDPKTLELMLATMNDMDRQVISQQRLQVTNKALDAQAQAHQVIAQIISTLGTNNPYLGAGGALPPPPQLPDINVAPELVEIGAPTQTYEEFQMVYQRSHPREA